MSSKGLRKSGYRIISALIACVLMSSAALIAAKLLSEKDCKTIYVCVNSKTLRSGEVTFRHEYSYDHMGNLILEKCYSGEILSETIEATYGDNTATIERKSYDSDGEVYQWQKKVYDYAERKLTNTAYNVMGPGNSKEEYTFDERYNIILYNSYSGDTVKYQRRCTYDNHGNMLSEETRHRQEPWQTEREYVYTYGTNGNFTSSVGYLYDNDIFVAESRQSYDERGNLISNEYISDGTHLISKTEYDKNDNVISETGYSNGNMTQRDEYTYDEHGNMLTFKEIWGDSVFLREYTYDDNGNCILEKEFSNGELRSYSESTYDDKGNLILWKDFFNGEQKFYKEYIYDEQGNMLSLKDFNADGTVRFLEEYSYDRHGNILSSTKYYRDNESETYIEYKYKKMMVSIENSVDTSFVNYLDAISETRWTSWAI